jgi:RimJ/RimL family protein N-acetyltransferase
MLRGERIGLRYPDNDDELSVIIDARADPKIMGKYCPPMLVKKEQLKQGNELHTVFFIILLSGTSKILGEISVIKYSPQKVEIGFWIFPKYRKQGYCLEAIHIILDYLFITWDVKRIQCEVHVDNKISQKTVENAGFQKEGVLRNNMFINGNWTDMIMYSILRSEWKEPKYLKEG